MYKVLRVFVFIAVTMVGASAEAVPAFARITGMGCPACHDSWPKLNDFGERYRDLGYRLRGDNVEQQPARTLSYAPLALRTTLAYQFDSATHQATDAGDKTISAGAFAFPEADLIIGTSLAPHFSVLAVASGFGLEGTASLESAWVRINSLGSSWANLKVGQLELDLPVSEHRSYSLTNDFLIYHFHPTGSSNGFSIGDNQTAIELTGHGAGVGLRYEVAVISAGGNPGSASPLSSPTAYTHLTYTTQPTSGVVSRLRVGLLGDGGLVPTSFATLAGEPVPGTGADLKPFFQAGGEVQATFGSLAAPLSFTGVWLYGQEDKGLIEGGTQNAKYQGGFAELDYTPQLFFTVALRADGIFNLQQGDTTQPVNSNQQEALTLSGRYALFLSPWGSVVWHTEVSTSKTENAGATPGTPINNTIAFTGLDVAF